jgi:hypothetical protein
MNGIPLPFATNREQAGAGSLIQHHSVMSPDCRAPSILENGGVHLKPESEFDPFRSRLCLPRYLAGLRRQDEARAVSGVVIELGFIRQSERLSDIGDAPGVPAPYVGIRNEVTCQRRTVPYSRDTSFRAVQSNKYRRLR